MLMKMGSFLNTIVSDFEHFFWSCGFFFSKLALVML